MFGPQVRNKTLKTKAANRSLVHALEEQGVRAQGIQHGVFVCDYLDKDELGLVGHIQRVDLEAVRDVAQRGILPVVAALCALRFFQPCSLRKSLSSHENWGVLCLDY